MVKRRPFVVNSPLHLTGLIGLQPPAEDKPKTLNRQGWVTQASHLAKLEEGNFSDVASATFGPELRHEPFSLSSAVRFTSLRKLVLYC